MRDQQQYSNIQHSNINGIRLSSVSLLCTHQMHGGFTFLLEEWMESSAMHIKSSLAVQFSDTR